jgi:peroxiredoxin
MKNTIALIIVSILILCTSLMILPGCESAAPCPELNKPAPDFTLLDLNNEKVTLSQLKGKTVVINFWATWCPWCIYELPFFQTAHDQYSDKNMVFLMIDSKESADTASRYVKEKKYTFPVLIDSTGQVTIQYCLPALPGTVIIDPSGMVVFGKLGAFQKEDQLIQVLETY